MINILISMIEVILLLYILYKFYKTRFRLYIKIVLTITLITIISIPYILEYKVYNYIPSKLEKELYTALDENMTDDEIRKIVDSNDDYTSLRILETDKEIHIEVYDVKLNRLIIVRRNK